MASAAEAKKVCKCCGFSYEEKDGRQHGVSFTCSQCSNIQQIIRRNLGTTADLQEWNETETHEFFRAAQKNKNDGRLKWTTIRASWIKKNTEAAEATIRKFASTVEKQPLPKSVWLQHGWEETVIDRLEPKWSRKSLWKYGHEPMHLLR